MVDSRREEVPDMNDEDGRLSDRPEDIFNYDRGLRA
jgi:hypothetical protein